MIVVVVTLAILAMLIVGYRMGVGKALSATGGQARILHSRPGYYGTYTALWCALPAFALMALWLIVQPMVIAAMIRGGLPADIRAMPDEDFDLVMTAIRAIAGGTPPSNVEPYMEAAAARIGELETLGQWFMAPLVLIVALAGIYFAIRHIVPDLRARNKVESVIKILLIICSSIAILTTVGIVASVLFEAMNFFSIIPPQDFFFNPVWDPGFARAGEDHTQHDFGLLPLMWGTLFISFIAMCVAAPIGLMSAIYLSEYATSRVRSVAKPLLEILAGIPTVVYGFFALTTMGPFLNTFGDTLGLDIQASSALTAGLVMGIMIVPFVSSLSDDIISQVPQAMRDGSYGMGATRSETITKVVFPAALPGIVGGLLLAVSRAIGETMIVVMAVGAAANLTANPFESVTTVTVMIVKQLTGDNEFSSPQTLVAFALGLTLFVVTLCLNVVALYVVRRYREQYE